MALTLLDGWISELEDHHHNKGAIEVSKAKAIASQWRIGWYVAPIRDRWQIGKMTIGTPFRKYAIVRDDGDSMHFHSVDEALAFFRKELGVFGVAMFQ
jgi:hypothetical protein